MRALLPVLLFVILYAPAIWAVPKQSTIESYRALVALDKRLATTGYRLAKTNAPFCKDKWRNPGWVLHSYRQYGDRQAVKAAFDFPLPVAIAALVDDGPADKAGLEVGNSVDLPGGIVWGADKKNSKGDSELIDAINIRLRKLFTDERPVNLIVRHKYSAKQLALINSGLTIPNSVVQLNPPPVCASYFLVSSGKQADAGADGETVRVSAKLAEFTPDEDEFAFLVAHELAHNILRHRMQLDQAKEIRRNGRRAGKSKKLIRKSEKEADRLAIWLMANAGYDSRAAISFMERWGRKYGRGLFGAGTHYKWKKRQEILRAEIAILNSAARRAEGYDLPFSSMGLLADELKSD